MLKKKITTTLIGTGVLLSIAPVANAGFSVIYSDEKQNATTTTPLPFSPTEVIRPQRTVTTTKDEYGIKTTIIASGTSLHTISATTTSRGTVNIGQQNNNKVIESIADSMTLTFNFNGTNVNADPDVLKQLINSSKNASAVVIVGYTDDVGKKAVNERIALNRANTIKQYLVRHGVETEKVSTSQNAGVYVNGNKTRADRQENRRAVVTFYW